MVFRERERERLVNARDAFFNDPGGAMFFGQPREFVLQDPRLNLFPGARSKIIRYFKDHRIGWWMGANHLPCGHLLSSQIACVNHLWAIRERCDLATAVLKAIDIDIVTAEFVPEFVGGQADDGFVAFEFIGKCPRLKERSFTRGANCTSLDAFMIGRTKAGERRAFLIEWKYVETYPSSNKYVEQRAKVYDHLIRDALSPFKHTYAKDFYYEPFYQLMRQTLLGWLMIKHGDVGCSSFRHVHVVPKANSNFRQGVTAPAFFEKTVCSAWKSVLKEPERFVTIDPACFMAPIRGLCGTDDLLNYLGERYWAGV